MKPFSRLEAENYLIGIAERNGIRIEWCNGRKWLDQAEAAGEARRVTIPRPWNMNQLLVALHEFGHLLGVLPLNSDPPADWDIATRTILAEAAAWAWAVDHLPDRLGANLHYKVFEKSVAQAMASHYWYMYTAHD